MIRFVLRNGKFILRHIVILIFISWKRTKATKIILKTKIDNGKCDNIGNTKKHVTHIPKVKADLFFILYSLLFKTFTDLQQILEIKKTLVWLKSQNATNLKTEYQQRGIKLRCSIDKKAILNKRLFSATLPTKLFLLEIIFTYFQWHVIVNLHW